MLGAYGLRIGRLRVVAARRRPAGVDSGGGSGHRRLHAGDALGHGAGDPELIVLLTMLMGGLYLAIDATAGERERGSLEPLLTVPVPREQLIYGKILAACAS